MTQNSLFDKVIACAQEVEKCFRETGEVEEWAIDEQRGVKDIIFSSGRYRRAHISTIDARATKKLYLLHITVFPHCNDSSPIYGFDIVCGPTKVSGAFLDLSASGDSSHHIMQSFDKRVDSMQWKKERELPDWAKQIFSPALVAIGSVDDAELDKVIKLGLDTLDMYLAEVGNTQESGADFQLEQNIYCRYQKQNPRTPASLMHLGFTEAEATAFVQNMLFPEVV